MTKLKIHKDEFMVVRTRDGAIVLDRVFLSEDAFATTPADLVMKYNIAHEIHSALKGELRSKVVIPAVLRQR